MSDVDEWDTTLTSIWYMFITRCVDRTSKNEKPIHVANTLLKKYNARVDVTDGIQFVFEDDCEYTRFILEWT